MNAIVRDVAHASVQKKGNLHVITMKRVLPDADSTSEETLAGQRKRLKKAIRVRMNLHPEFEETHSGSRIAYEKRTTHQD